MYQHFNPDLTLADALAEYQGDAYEDHEDALAFINQERYRITARYWHREYWHVHSPGHIWEWDEGVDEVNWLIDETNIAEVKLLNRWTERIEYHRANPSKEEAAATQQMFDLIPLEGG